jgi:putative DNA primase/helicase
MTAALTHGEVVSAFLSAMAASGIKPTGSIAQDLLSGELVRFHVAGDRASRRNGWARLHFDGCPAGAFGCNKRQIHEKWRAGTEGKVYSKAERVAFAKRMQAERAERAAAKQATEEATAARARAMLGKSGPAGDHPYLASKRIPGKGMRKLGNLLLVPMHGADGDVWNVQCIAQDAQKRFLTAGRTAGLMFPVQGSGNVVLVAEGAATAAALHRATGATCYSAFSAGNLLAVAEMARLTSPDTRIVVCADDDQHLIDHPSVRRNVGLDEAIAAAIAVRGFVAKPPRPSEAAGGWDFADVHDDGLIRQAVTHAEAAPTLSQRTRPLGSLESRLAGSRSW